MLFPHLLSTQYKDELVSICHAVRISAFTKVRDLLSISQLFRSAWWACTLGGLSSLLMQISQAYDTMGVSLPGPDLILSFAGLCTWFFQGRHRAVWTRGHIIQRNRSRRMCVCIYISISVYLSLYLSISTSLSYLSLSFYHIYLFTFFF